jgi:hypothetical protein
MYPNTFIMAYLAHLASLASKRDKRAKKARGPGVRSLALLEDSTVAIQSCHRRLSILPWSPSAGRGRAWEQESPFPPWRASKLTGSLTG